MRVAAVACLLAAGVLRAEEIVCPTTVAVRQVATEVPAGWTASVTTAPVTLSYVTFFDGKPDQEASLVYDRMVQGRTHNRAEWDFAPGSRIWLACTYAGTSVVLSRELPGVTRCVVAYRKNSTASGPPPIDRITCR
jgi:hypothetical protein